MLIQKIKTYKWQALASLLMTGLMVASSLLQPRYLQEVLDALLAGKYEAIYSIGIWLIGVALVGLVAGGLNVVLAAYIAQGVSSDLREDAFRKIQTFSYANIEPFNAGNLVVRMTNDINQIQNVVMMTFQILFRLWRSMGASGRSSTTAFSMRNTKRTCKGCAGLRSIRK